MEMAGHPGLAMILSWTEGPGKRVCILFCTSQCLATQCWLIAVQPVLSPHQLAEVMYKSCLAT